MTNAAVQPQLDAGRKRVYLGNGAVEFDERHGYERQAVVLRKRLA